MMLPTARVNIACYADRSRYSCATAEMACRRITRHFLPFNASIRRWTNPPWRTFQRITCDSLIIRRRGFVGYKKR